MISIIIPTYNRAHLISETLDSVQAQTYQNWECIIVDDGSTDNTDQLIASYVRDNNRFKYFRRPNTKPKGANACRNYGLNKSQGDYIIFFDSDDVMATNCLEGRLKAFDSNQEYDMLVFAMGVFDTKDNCQVYKERMVVNLSLSETIYAFLFLKLPWNICRPIFKASLIRNRIEFNENMQNFQDDEFNLRLLAHLKPRYFSFDITDVYYRYDIESITKYNNTAGCQDILNSFYEYSNTMFYILSNKQIQEYRKKMMIKLFNIIKSYVTSKTTNFIVYKTIRRYSEELNFTIQEKLILKILVILNSYYFKKKGYYKLTKNLLEYITH